MRALNRLNAPPRVSVFLPLALDWQPTVPFDLADDRRRLLKVATAAVQADAVIVDACLISSTHEAVAAAERARHGDADVVLVVVTMAVLPSVALAAIDELADCRLVLWVLQQSHGLGEGTDHASIVADGGTVGGPMLTSLLVRKGRPFELILGRHDDPSTIDTLGWSIRCAAAARRISTARIGRVGRPADGYECVDVDEDRLRQAIGVTVVPIDPGEFVQLFHEVPESAVQAVVEETRSRYTTDPGSALTSGDLARAARAAAALEGLVARHELDGGAITCHIDGIRFGSGLGFAPCFALGTLTSRGVPWCCSSDIPAAMAMLALKSLGAAALYHELEMLDLQSGDFLIANSGEHDLSFAGEEPRLVRNGWFPKDRYPSICACFGPRPGPATLLGFAQLDAPKPVHRFVVAAGEFSARSFDVGTPHAAFRFAHGPPETAWLRWCRGGVGLHTACTPGDFVVALETLGHFLGIEVVNV